MSIKRKGPLAAKPGYEVGYAKPPKSTQFKKGQSGNPRGRPRGRKKKLPQLHEERMKEIILEEAYRGIALREGIRNVTVPIVRAVLRSLAVNAVKGQHRAQRLFVELLAAVEGGNRQSYDEYLQGAMDYKIAWERELDRRERLGITDLPDPVPHPDHVVINMGNGTAKIIGPWTRQEKEELDLWSARRADFEEELKWLEEELENPDPSCSREFLEAEIASTRKVLEMIDTALGAVPKPGSTRLLGKNG